MIDLPKQQNNKLKINIKCQQLNKIFYKQVLNAYLLVSSQKFNKKPEIIHKSETVNNNFNPLFNEPVYIEQSFEENQTFIFQIFNYGFDSLPIGEIKLNASEIVKSLNGLIVKQLDTGFKKGGRLILDLTQISIKKQLIHLKLRGEELQSKSWLGWFGAKFYYFRINRIHGNSCESLYVSEQMPQNQFIQWKQFYIEKFETDDLSKIQIQICRKKNQKGLQTIAKGQLSWTQLGKASCFDVYDQQKNRYAKITIQNYKAEIEHTFNEFVKAGMNINFMVGIDFSASILPANHQDSPHHHRNGDSIYLKALLSASQLVLNYTDKLHASVYAIGAKIKHPKNYTGQKVQQCFPLNANFQKEKIQGIQKIRQQFKSTLNYITFSGPTDINIIIQKALQESAKAKSLKQQYTVLLILCDGKLTNIKQIQETLKKCATLPIYIGLLSIGNNDQNLKELTTVKMQVISAENNLVLRQHLINVGHYLGKGDNICDSIQHIFKKLPYVIQKYMSLKKKTPESLCSKIKMLKQKHNPQV